MVDSLDPTSEAKKKIGYAWLDNKINICNKIKDNRYCAYDYEYKLEDITEWKQSFIIP